MFYLLDFAGNSTTRPFSAYLGQSSLFQNSKSPPTELGKSYDCIPNRQPPPTPLSYKLAEKGANDVDNLTTTGRMEAST